MPSRASAHGRRAVRAGAPPAPAAAASFPHRAPGSLALERILYAPKRRDGGRHVNIGQTGSGKSYLTRALLEELRGRCKWIFVLDDKDADHTDYPGLQYVDVEAFKAQPPQKVEGQVLERRIIFRGDKYGGIECPAEDVAALCREFAQSGVEVCMVLDEGKRAAQGRNPQVWTADSVPWTITEGRSLGLWVIGCWTSAKRTPDEMLNEASTVAVFRQKARAANYLVELFDLDEQLEDVITHLGEGEFVLLAAEEDWDGRIYRL